MSNENFDISEYQPIDVSEYANSEASRGQVAKQEETITEEDTEEETSLVEQKEEKEVKELDPDVLEDFNHARKMYYELIQQGRDAIEELKHVAESSESPRAYEVLANLIRSVSDNTDKLMRLRKETEEAQRSVDERKGDFTEDRKTQNVQQNNAMIFANSKDFQLVMRELRNGNMDALTMDPNELEQHHADKQRNTRQS